MSEQTFQIKTEILEGEYWWGGGVSLADKMPFTKDSEFVFDMDDDVCGVKTPID